MNIVKSIKNLFKSKNAVKAQEAQEISLTAKSTVNSAGRLVRDNFGPEFDFGVIEFKKIRIKLGDNLTMTPDGVIHAVIGPPTTAFISSSNPADINFDITKVRHVINVDTSLSDYDTTAIDFSVLPAGAEVIFRKNTADSNKILDGKNDHTNKEGETVCFVYDGTDTIII